MCPISIRICVQYLGAVRRSCREKRGYRHTDSWHEWLQDNFYGGSATKRIVIKEPSFELKSRFAALEEPDDSKQEPDDSKQEPDDSKQEHDDSKQEPDDSKQEPDDSKQEHD